MAIFKYKKPNGSGGYTYEEMPVISNIYTEYVVQNATDGTRTITLTPTKTSDSTGPGAFEDVTASIKFLNQNPSYTPSANSRIINFATEYGNNGFPSEITIDAIPSNWLNKNTDASTPPNNLTIATQGGTKTIDAGYYANDIVVTAQFPENTTSGTISLKPKTKTSQSVSIGYYSNGFSVSPSTQVLTSTNPSLTYNSSSGYYEKTYEPSTTSGAAWGDKYLTKFTLQFTNQSPSSSQTLKPSNSSYPIPTGYHASSRTVSVNTSPLTISNPTLTLNSGTASVTISPTASGTWVNTYYPSSITVSFTGVDTNNIVSGTSVCGIAGSHVCSGIDTSSATAYSTLYTYKDRIPDGYKVYGSGNSNYVTGTMALHTHNDDITSKLTTQNATRTIEAGYHDGKETIKVELPASTMTKTFTDSSYSSVSRSAGYYNAGTISINSGNLTASNIKKDVTILGVKGTYEGTTYTELTGSTSLSPSSFTYDESGMSPFYGYAVAGSTSKRVHDYTLKIYSNSKTITTNDTYTLFGSSANWNAIPTQITVAVPEDITHGSIANTSLYYTLTLDNVLTFSGTGDIPDDFISNYLSSYTSYIYSIDMSFAFISSIGNYAFNGCSYVRFLSFSPFTKTIGYFAFYNINSALRTFNTALRLVVMPVSLTSIDAYIFYGCWIRNLWFPGRPLTSWPQYGLNVGNDGKIYDLRYAWSSSQHSSDMGADPVYTPKFDANFGNITSLT